eukprot:349662-Chlamydomonas_euryale.AAC.1
MRGGVCRRPCTCPGWAAGRLLDAWERKGGGVAGEGRVKGGGFNDAPSDVLVKLQVFGAEWYFLSRIWCGMVLPELYFVRNGTSGECAYP